MVNNSKISDMTPASDTVFVRINVHYIILEWTTSLDTSSRTLFVREGGDVHVTSNVVLCNYVRLLLNVELRNYVISRQIVERRVT